MTAITITNHELLQLKLLLRDIQLIQKMNSPFDNEAIEILSFKIIEHINTNETLKDYHIVDVNEMVEISDEEIAIEFAEWIRIKDFQTTAKDNWIGLDMQYYTTKELYAKWYREQLKQRQ